MKKHSLTMMLALLMLGLGLPGVHAQSFPAFQFTDLSGEPFTQDQLEADMTTIAIFFDPYCEHCTQQAKWITESADLFDDVQMIWVTTEMEEPTKAFYEEHFADRGLPHVHVLMDKDFMFDAYFGYSEVPSIYIYDKQGKRIKSLSKETPAADLRRIIDKKS